MAAVQGQTRNYSFDDVPGSLPTGHTVPEDVDLAHLSQIIVARLPNLQADDFTEDALWRDILAFTNTWRTLSSAETIACAFAHLSTVKKPSNFAPDTTVCGPATILRLGSTVSWVDIPFTFSTDDALRAKNAGIVSVVPDEHHQAGWRIWMLRTWLENYEGHGNPDEPAPASGPTDMPDQSAVYDAIIVGGGQAGLGVAGRLKALGCTHLLLEKNSEVGQNWTRLYDSLRLHTIKDYNNLPFGRTYRETDDAMLTTEMVGSGFKRWVEQFGINVQLNTVVDKAEWDESTQLWTISVTNASGPQTIQAKNLILASGLYASKPITPTWPGRSQFRGTAMHGSEYKTSKPWAGQRGIVVGTANTAQDVAENMVDAGFASVTMVQRGKTFVLPAEWLHAAQKSE